MHVCTHTFGFFIIWIVETIVNIKNEHPTVISKISFIAISLNIILCKIVIVTVLQIIPDVHPNPKSLIC